ncbi:MAG: ComEC/Rec2 family competence protein [Kiritimatiellia bacterium]
MEVQTMVRRPLVGIAAVFICGVALGLHTGDGIAAACSWLGMAGLWLVVQYVPGGVRLQGFVTLLVVFTTGWLVSAIATDQRRAEVHRLRAQESRAGNVVVYGTVSGDVDVHALAHGGARYLFALRQVRVVRGAETNRMACLPVRVTWYGPSVAAADPARCVPASGEIWRFTGKLRVQRTGVLRKTYVRLESREKTSGRVAAASLRDWQTLADRARQVTAVRLARGIEGWGAMPELVQAMFLGTRSAIPRELSQVFRDSGTIHIFAISGMNVALLAVVLIAMLSLAGVPRTMWCLPLAPILIFYTVVTGLSASALRACLMAVLYFGAPLLGRKPDGLSTLGAAAVIALAINPFQLLDAGFALSFVVMGGLILLYVPLAELIRRGWHVDDAALDARASSALGGELDLAVARRRTLRVKLMRYTADLVAMSVAAWLSSAPLTAWYFGRLTMSSLLANLPIAPAAFFTGVASSVGLLAGLVSHRAEAVLNNAAGGLTQLMVWCAQVTVAMPGGSMQITNPPLWMVGCWYAGLLLLAWWLWRLTRTTPPGTAWMRPG